MITPAPVLAIVVPCYNEREMLPLSVPAFTTLLDNLVADSMVAPESFLLLVDDGSTDGTREVIVSLCQGNPRVRAIRLGFNSGQQNALMAGLESVAGKCDCVVTADADLQDDINAIPAMLQRYAAGAEVVYGVRACRTTDSRFKRESAAAFYATQQRLGVRVIPEHSDFRLLSASALATLLQYRERNLFLRALIPSMGLREDIVEYERAPRQAGKSKYPLRRMLNFSADGITSFSIRPVRMVFFIGLVFIVVALCILVYVLIRHFSGHTDAGWSSLMLSIWFVSGVLLVSLGVIGEYVGKIYYEVKHRPRYRIVEEIGKNFV